MERDVNVFEYMREYDFEQLVFCQDAASGLRAVIAIHSTSLGPALGGTRMWSYASEDEAVLDALRLARGMSYKSAVAGLPLGGGKAVIIGDPARDKSEALFRAYGRFIHRLNGIYITAEDVCTCPEDMDLIRMETCWVQGTSSGPGGDPSPYTARGVMQGIRAAFRFLEGDDSLQGRTVAVQGLGAVGRRLCRLLLDQGARLAGCDIDPDRCREAETMGVRVVDPEEIYQVPCDVFAPCAMGGVINDSTVGILRSRIVAGGANNVLERDEHARALQDRGVLYVPDYVINAGGVISVGSEVEGFEQARVLQRVDGIFDTCLEILRKARAEGVPTLAAANRIAEERMATKRNPG
jgi:leucine dehydrogenase